MLLSRTTALFLLLVCVASAFHWHQRGEMKSGGDCVVCTAVQQSKTAVISPDHSIQAPFLAEAFIHCVEKQVCRPTVSSTPPSRAPPHA